MEKRVESGKKTGKWETREQKVWESGKHRISAFKRHSSVSTFSLSPRLGLACEIGSTQASALWTPVTTPSAAISDVARYRHYHRPPPLLPPLLVATTAASNCCVLLPLDLPITVAAAFDCHIR